MTKEKQNEVFEQFVDRYGIIFVDPADQGKFLMGYEFCALLMAERNGVLQ